VFISNCYASDHILYSKCPLLVDTQAFSRLGKSFTLSAMDFCSKAVQICCSVSFNSGIVLGIAWCIYVAVKVAKMWINLMM